MDPLPYIFLFIVIALGGVIAFFADRLGRKLGKKRLSLFGLRPRHTAEVLTIGAGVLIPLLTILTVFVLSKDVRIWITEGRHAVQQRDEALSEVNKLEKSSRVLQTNIQKQADQSKRLNKTILDKNKQLKELQERVDKSTAEVKRAAGRVGLLTNQVHASMAKLRANTQSLSKAKLDLQDAIKQRKVVNAALKSAKATRDYVEKENADLKAEGLRSQHELDAQIADLTAEIRRLSTQRTKLDADLESKQKELESSQQELAEAKKELEAADTKLESRLKDINNLLAVIDASRTSPMIFRKDEELTRIEIPAFSKPSDVRGLLMSMDRTARSIAIQNGAIKSDQLPSIVLFDVAADGRVIPPQEIEDGIVAKASNLPQASVLIGTSWFNVFVSEFVRFKVRGFSDPIVYIQGELVLEKRIDGRKTEDEIFSQLKEFLADVQKKALRDHMIPVHAGTEDTIGTVSSETILSLVKEIKADNTIVRLQAVARDQTRAAQPLNLVFKVRF